MKNNMGVNEVTKPWANDARKQSKLLLRFESTSGILTIPVK